MLDSLRYEMPHRKFQFYYMLTSMSADTIATKPVCASIPFTVEPSTHSGLLIWPNYQYRFWHAKLDEVALHVLLLTLFIGFLFLLFSKDSLCQCLFMLLQKYTLSCCPYWIVCTSGIGRDRWYPFQYFFGIGGWVNYCSSFSGLEGLKSSQNIYIMEIAWILGTTQYLVNMKTTFRWLDCTAWRHAWPRNLQYSLL